jgi:subtilisin family serine protease
MNQVLFGLVITNFLVLGLAQISRAAESSGYLFEVLEEKSPQIVSMVRSGQVELLKLSFGTFGFVSEAKAANFNLLALANPTLDGPIGKLEANVSYSPMDDTGPSGEEPSPIVPSPTEPQPIAPPPSNGSGAGSGDDSPILDYYWKNQWGFLNTGKNNWLGGPAREDIHALEAWQITKGSKELIVAVIDSGLMIDHPDIQENVFTNVAERDGLVGVDDDGNGYVDDVHGYDFAHDDPNPEDELGHGTHVAGLIGASHNSIGIAGMMAHVQIMPLKFITGERKGDTKHALMAIDYAIKMGAKVINSSWGSDTPSELLEKAIWAAHEKGILFVASAGNSKNDNDVKPVYPSGYAIPNVVSVGANNGRGEKASFSSFGKTSVHLFAPGYSIISLAINEKELWRSGTSMSTPIVSGALGLLLSVHPELDAPAARARLLATTDHNEAYAEFGVAGRLNVYRLLIGR